MTVLRVVAAWKPLDAVVLGVDPGATSGVAITVNGKILSSGSCTGQDYVPWVCRAEKLQVDLQRPLVVAMETWTPHGKWGFKQALSLGEQAGRWLGMIERVCIDALVVRVEPGEWRRALFGGVLNRPTKVWKDLALMHALAATDSMCREDEAEAICMALWASRSNRVDEELVRHRRKVRRERAAQP